MGLFDFSSSGNSILDLTVTYDYSSDSGREKHPRSMEEISERFSFQVAI